MNRWIFAFVVAVILAAGCAPASTPTSVPPTVTLAPPPTPTPTASPSLPRPGDWNATADALGELVLRVSDDSRQITLVSVSFTQFTCQGKGIEGEWLPSAFSSAVTDRQFVLSGILAGYMELSLTGQSLGVSEFPEFDFSGMFDETGKRMNGTWNADWAGATCSGTWSSDGSTASAATPMATLPASVTSADPLYLDPFCNCEADIPAGKLGYLRWGWVAAKEESTEDFVFASQTTVIVDGTPYTGLEMYWGGAEYSAQDKGYRSTWTYLLPALGPGKHHVEIRLSLSRSVTDGYDDNGDGQPDQYGPGETFYGWVDVKIPGTTTATEAAGGACPNGAPKGTWKLIVNKTQAGGGTITIDGQASPIHSGQNVFYLAAGQPHPILVGSNTMNMSALECGENTLNVP